MDQRLSTAAVLAATLVLTTLAGCELNVNDVQGWREIPEGARRIAALVPDEQRPLKLRLEAAMILVDMDRTYTLAEALAQTKPESRKLLVGQMLPRLLPLLETETGQTKAANTLYFVGGYLDGAAKEDAARALVSWAAEDFSGRYALGRVTLAQVMPAVGTGSVRPLLEVLSRGEAVPEVTRILAGFDSPRVHDEAAATLVALLRQQGPAAPPESWAALTTFTTPILVPFMIEELADPAVPAQRKDALFDHVVRCKGEDAAPGLAGLLTHHDLRWIAAQNVLAVEGLPGVARVLQSLPPSDGVYEEGELYDEIHFFCSERVPLLKADRAALQAALVAGLDATRPLAAVTAVHCLELHGDAEALPALEEVAKSDVAVVGWNTEDGSLKAIATAAAETISKRGG